MAKRLNKKILDILVKKTGKTVGTLRKEISLAKRELPSATSNAAAQVIARRHKTSVLQKLDAEDRASVPASVALPVTNRAIERSSRSGKKVERKLPPALFDYVTTDFFKGRHIKELFRANAAGCFTSAFILSRKIVENLIVDILRARYPGNAKANVELYYNVNQHRFRDFSEILDNLRSKRSDFGIDGESVIDRILQLTKPFKKDANDKAHSWFHIVETRDELERIPLETIVELIKKLEMIVGLRTSKSGSI